LPYARPTLTELNGQALQDIQSAQIGGVDGLLQKAVLRVLARAQSGLAYEHYGYQDWIARMAVPWTARDEFLEGWAALKGVTRKAASYAALTATFTGTPGVTMPSGTTVATANSLSFSTTADATVGSTGSVTVPIAATTAGSASNLAVGTAMTLSGAITGINSSGAVASSVTAGADQETDDAFRTRMLQVYAAPPQGGAQDDYVTWVEDVAGVTRAWCNPNGAGVGTAVVYFMMDDVRASQSGFPQGTNGVASAESRDTAATGDQLTVADAIYPLRPVTALVYACAPVANPISFVIADLSPATSTVIAGITTALQDLFVRIGTPLGMTIYPSDWNEAIASVAGIEHFNVTSPAAPVTLSVGQLPTLSGTPQTSA